MSWAFPRVTASMSPMADDAALSEGEHTVLLLHPHWKILLRPTLILLLVAAAAAVVLLMIPPGSYATPGRIAVGVLAVVVAVTWSVSRSCAGRPPPTSSPPGASGCARASCPGPAATSR